ncbi:hypothetical protein Talka_01354 [Tepidimonas alkaliphilus]|uniref:DUF3782 domain-containing protein n=1 Tax=Tepidimonas alkaliphilus TaxID=2588942 RepID=A0A554W7T7_9BURK|nr:hypothetical protein [Tepidimonas alkaliphilus]TSE19635.1 hypothetical protein Talka_01354 [Tepidimonas alkaliphilus]
MVLRLQEIDHRIRELRETGRETDRQLRELKRQIGGLGDKFGSFGEGVALPTMERLLRRRFHMDNVAPRLRVRRDDREREYDVLAWANGKVNTVVVVVEVKSRVKREAIGQLIEQLQTLFEFLPELKGKARIGILAGIDGDAGVEEEAQAAGLYTARIRDEMFELTTPKRFKPRRWRVVVDRPRCRGDPFRGKIQINGSKAESFLGLRPSVAGALGRCCIRKRSMSSWWAAGTPAPRRRWLRPAWAAARCC